MIFRCTFVFIVLALASRAEETCPWLNAATAGGVLGAPVQTQIAPHVCSFVSRHGELRIQVETIAASHADHCSGASEQLKAIGNEAAACAVESKDGRMAEQVAGRVRDQAFVITIATDDRSLSRNLLRDKVRKVAEQVAGNLF
jgi:hypothetical protein